MTALPLLDISEFQRPETIDYDAIAEQISGVIIRIGFTGYVTGKTAKDKAFEKHYEEFKKRKIPLGGYYVVVGNSAEMGIAEARCCLELISNKALELGIWCDTEWISDDPQARFKTQSYPKHKLTAAVLSFCQAIETSGRQIGIYASEDWFNDYLDSKYLEQFEWWVAKYKSEPKIKYKYWQHTNKGHLKGYSGDLDLSKERAGEQIVRPILYTPWLKRKAPITTLQDPKTITAGAKYNNPYIKYPLIELGKLNQTGNPYPDHKGIDFGVPEGTRIYAPYSGRIWATTDMRSCGNRIVLIAAGKKFGANHLSRFLIRSGNVEAGTLIGYVGNTGNSRGAHLHVDVFDDEGGCYDAYPYAMGIWNEYGNVINQAPDIYPDPDPYEYELPQPVTYIVDTGGDDLNVRRRPGIQFEIVSKRENGTAVTIDKRCDLPNGDIWGRLKPWNWICLKRGKWLVKDEPKQIYRVRKDWNDHKSQIGAFRNLDNARAAALETGLNIYDERGREVK